MWCVSSRERISLNIPCAFMQTSFFFKSNIHIDRAEIQDFILNNHQKSKIPQFYV